MHRDKNDWFNNFQGNVSNQMILMLLFCASQRSVLLDDNVIV